MSWKKLQLENKVHKHSTSRQELDQIRRLIARDLADAEIAALSDDRRFATVYNAAQQSAKMAIACAGYRIASSPGHHKLTFDSLKLALGSPVAALADYFDSCRRKRNEIDYTGAVVATTTETQEILVHAKALLQMVEEWIESKHPAFKR